MGLPPYGSEAKSFPKPGAFREGYVVEFTPTRGERWIGNFESGHYPLDDIRDELGEDAILVVAGGDVYLVNAPEQRLVEELPWAREVRFERDLELFLIVDDCAVTAVGRSGVQWRSRRVSWDGIAQLERQGRSLLGLAYNMGDLPPVPFVIDLATGEASGGSY